MFEVPKKYFFLVFNKITKITLFFVYLYNLVKISNRKYLFKKKPYAYIFKKLLFTVWTTYEKPWFWFWIQKVLKIKTIYTLLAKKIFKILNIWNSNAYRKKFQKTRVFNVIPLLRAIYIDNISVINTRIHQLISIKNLKKKRLQPILCLYIII